jgi:hypothetical protein
MEVQMPALVRLYIQSIVIGFVLAAVFTAGLIGADVAGLGHLVMGSDLGFVAVAMLVIFNGLIFSAVQFGFRIMALAEDDAPKGGHRAGRLIPVRVEARAIRKPRH